MVRRSELAAVFAAAAAAASATGAWASPIPPASVTAAAPAPSPLVLELRAGWQDPLGTAGLALVFDRGSRFSGGVGVGLEHWSRESLPAFGIFGRARLVQLGPVSLGAAATLSRVHADVERHYDRSPAGAYPTDDLQWSWEPGYRASVALGAELDGDRWSARLEGGTGYLLNDPHCAYNNRLIYADGCDASDFPASYRFQVQPGRVMPSLTASLGYRFGVPTPPESARQPDGTTGGPSSIPPSPPTFKSPEMAFTLSFTSTLAPMAVGLGMLAVNGSRSDTYLVVSLAAIAAGLTIGPSVGHVYTGEYLRAGGLALARLTALFVGSFMVFAATERGDCEDGSPGSCNVPGVQVALGVVALLFSVPVLAVYDIAMAPASARRANERNGLRDLGVVPMITASGPTPGRGLALAGRF